MPLQNPVAVYTARTNTEAQLVAHLLGQVGVEAHVTEDLSLAGLWVGGTVAGIHRPQVWVDRADLSRAEPVLRDYERRTAESAVAAGGPDVEAVCEECGRPSAFPAAQRGTVQDCPHCGATMDVGDDGDADWGGAEDEELE
jgi:hypothetical protein